MYGWQKWTICKLVDGKNGLSINLSVTTDSKTRPSIDQSALGECTDGKNGPSVNLSVATDIKTDRSVFLIRHTDKYTEEISATASIRRHGQFDG